MDTETSCCTCACKAASFVEFEQETILMRWDPKKDVLHVRLIYWENRVTLALGADPDAFVRVHWTPNPGRYVPNLLDRFAEGEKPPELPAPVGPKASVAQLESSFMQRFEVRKSSR